MIQDDILDKAMQSLESKIHEGENKRLNYQKLFELQQNIKAVASDNLSEEQIKKLKNQIQKIYKGRGPAVIDYSQFERPHHHINLLDDQIKLTQQKIKNEQYKLSKNLIKEETHRKNTILLKAQIDKFSDMKNNLRNNNTALEPQLQNQLNSQIHRIQELLSAKQIQNYEIDYNDYENNVQNDIIDRIKRQFNLEQMNLSYVDDLQTFTTTFDENAPFRIITEQPFVGQKVGKHGQQNNFIFTNIRYIIQYDKIIPIGFLIQNKQIDILRILFNEIFSNAKQYLTRDIRYEYDLLSFQNIGVRKAINFKVEDLLKALFEPLDDFYASEQDLYYDNGYEIVLLVKNIGQRYQQNLPLETKFKGTIFFVKNGDNKCLYAAIVSAYIKKAKVVDRKYIFKLGDQNYTLPAKAFDEGRQMQSYADKPRIQNLYFFTQLFIYLINKGEEDLSDSEILERAETYLKLRIKVTQIDKNDDLRPASEEDLLLVLCQLTDKASPNHYNVIMDFKGYINIQKPSYKDYRYCYNHQQMYRSKGQCEQCVIEKDVEVKEYCSFCNYTHVRPSNKEWYQCKDCKSVCKGTPDKCVQYSTT